MAIAPAAGWRTIEWQVQVQLAAFLAMTAQISWEQDATASDARVGWGSPQGCMWALDNIFVTAAWGVTELTWVAPFDEGGRFAIQGYLPAEGCSVTLDGNPCTDLHYDAVTTTLGKFTCNAPSGHGTVAGVINCYGNKTAKLKVIYANDPTIAFMTTIGSLGGWSLLNGTYLYNSISVTANDIPVDFEWLSETQLRVKMPAVADLNRTVAVRMYVAGKTAEFPFHNYEAPELLRVAALIPQTGGLVSFLGKNLGATVSQVFLTINGVQCNVIAVNHSWLNCTIGVSGTGDAEVFLRVSYQTFNSSMEIYQERPIIEQITNVQTGGGYAIITGKNFGPDKSHLVTLTIGSITNKCEWGSPTSATCYINRASEMPVINQRQAVLTVDGSLQSDPHVANFSGPTIYYATFANTSGQWIIIDGFSLGGQLLNVTAAGHTCDCIVIDHSRGICFVPPGTGKGKFIYENVFGTAYVPWQYQSPDISWANRTLPPGGATDLVVRGYNFGQPGITSAAIVINNQRYAAAVIDTNTILGTAPPGVLGSTFRVEVDGVISKNSWPFTYGEILLYPVFDVPTVGGATVLTGTNFKGSDPVIKVDGVSCSSASVMDDSHIVFTAGAGAGKNHNLSVTLQFSNGAFVSRNTKLSYGPPRIDNINAPSQGLASALLSGINLADGSYPVRLTWDCYDRTTQLLSHTMLTFTVPAADSLESFDSSHQVIVYVGDQSSLPYAFNYSAPEITSADPVLTLGGPLRLFGSSFGPPGTPLCVTVNGVPCANASAVNHTFVTCFLPGGVGQNLPVSVISPCTRWSSVVGAPREATNPNTNPSFQLSYPEPSIDSLYPTTFPTSGGVLHAIGRNFGSSTVPLAAVMLESTEARLEVYSKSDTSFAVLIPASMGFVRSISFTLPDTPDFFATIGYSAPTLTSMTATPTTGGTTFVTGTNLGTDASRIQVPVGGGICTNVAIRTDHTVVMCTAPPGAGSVHAFVVVDGQSSSSMYFTYLPPTIDTTFKYSTPTQGGLLQIVGTNFGPEGFSTKLTVDGNQCTQLWHNHTHLTCQTPAGIGHNLSLEITVGERGSVANAFSYADPVVTSSDMAPTQGSFIQVYGTGFGPAGTSVEILLGGTPCAHAVVYTPHESFRCLAAAGVGGGIDIRIKLNNVTYESRASYNYQLPTVISVGSTDFDTGGRTTVSGTNFGTDKSLINVTIGGRPCPVEEVTVPHFQLTCWVSPGDEEYPLPVKISVMGRTSVPTECDPTNATTDNCYRYVDTTTPVCVLSAQPCVQPSAGGDNDECRVIVNCTERVYGLNASAFTTSAHCFVVSVEDGSEAGPRYIAWAQVASGGSAQCEVILRSGSVWDKHHHHTDRSEQVKLSFSSAASSGDANKVIAIALGISLPAFGLLLVLCLLAAAILVVVLLLRKRKNAQDSAPIYEEGSHMLGTTSETYDEFDPSTSEPRDFSDFLLKVSVDRLSFGLGSKQAVVDEPLQEKFEIRNPTQHPVTFKLFPPQSERFHISVSVWGDHTVKPGHHTNVTVELVVRCTAKIGSIMYLAAAEGTSLESTVQHVCLPIALESALSFKLDPREIELKTPPVGEGSFGMVYRGLWRGQEVAVKLLKDQESFTSDSAEEFDKEVHMMEMLHIPQTVTFIGAVIFPSQLSIVTEFLPLGSVTSAMQKHPFSFLLKLKCLLNCAQGMDFLHQSGIIHRDLKSDNLLMVSLDPSALINCKISDFGTTRSLNIEVTSKLTKGIGTPTFMSPGITAIWPA
eukprot:TRINITY_DN7296_c0_g1_i1.p1 TRINITY_DN7296_c0_g1~~TRINITY_DN7296_c0_g1_i1.p1  ORF type:complete len:1886 (+),score=216.32 TRINITY_DN7296_c0_g1_i1:405-5660(+)